MKTASSQFATARALPSLPRLQLACLAASPAAMRAAVDAGADWVRIPFSSMQAPMTGLKNGRTSQAVRYAHGRGRKLALDLHAQGSGLAWPDYRKAVEWAAAQDFDAIVISDFAWGLYSTTNFPTLAVHFVAPHGICGRTARLLKVQMNVARILVPSATSLAELVEISSSTDAEVEVLASSSTSQSLAADRTFIEASCNDPCYTPAGDLMFSLRQLSLMALLGVRAIQVAPRSELSEEVASTTRMWRAAIDRYLEDGKQYATHSDWPRLLGLQTMH